VSSNGPLGAGNLTIGSSDHGAHLRWAKEGVDDLDKSASMVVAATPRRSTSSLGAILRTSFFGGLAAFLGLAGSTTANAEGTASVEQAVLVHFEYGSTDWTPFFAFEKKLQERVDVSGVGDYDGNELATSGVDGYLYMYGPDADKLYAVAEPLLRSCALLKNATVTLVYGKLGDNSVRRKVLRLGS
jgi:hypothetical protein